MRDPKVIEYVRVDMPDSYSRTLSCVVNPDDNGGEAVTLSIDVYDNGIRKFANTFIETQCYGVHSARIGLFGVEFEQLTKAHELLKSNM